MTADKYTPTTPSAHTEISMEQIAHSIRMTRDALDNGVDELPYDITERLRAARVRALAQAKSNTATVEKSHQKDISDIFNWKHKMTNWLKGGIAVSAFTLALVISVVSIRSELTTNVAVADRAISMTGSTSTETTTPATGSAIEQTASTEPLTTQSNPNMLDNAKATLHASTAPLHHHGSNPTAIAATKENSALVKNSPAAITASAEAIRPTPSTQTAPTGIAGLSAVDDEIGMVLREQIPLQAYLNDDFARYANHQGLDTIEKTSSQSNSSIIPEQ